MGSTCSRFQKEHPDLHVVALDDNPLIQALISRDNVEAAKHMEFANYSIGGVTALELAVALGDLEMVTRLLTSGAVVTQRTYEIIDTRIYAVSHSYFNADKLNGFKESDYSKRRAYELEVLLRTFEDTKTFESSKVKTERHKSKKTKPRRGLSSH